jgi:hypothetical protein
VVGELAPGALFVLVAGLSLWLYARAGVETGKSPKREWPSGGFWRSATVLIFASGSLAAGAGLAAGSALGRITGGEIATSALSFVVGSGFIGAAALAGRFRQPGRHA